MPEPNKPLKKELKLPIFEILLFVAYYLLGRASSYWTEYFDWSTGVYIIFIIIDIWVFGVIIFIGLKYQKRTLSGILAFKKVKFEISLGLILLSIGLVLFTTFMWHFIINFFLGYEEYYSYYDGINFESYRNPILEAIDGAFIPGVFEEIMMKGVIYYSLRKKYSKLVSVIIASIIFAVAHLDPNPLRLIDLFLSSLFTFWIYLFTKNLLFPIFVHFFNNLVAIFLRFDSVGLFGILFISIFISLAGVYFLYTEIKYEREKKKLNTKINQNLPPE